MEVSAENDPAEEKGEKNGGKCMQTCCDPSYIGEQENAKGVEGCLGRETRCLKMLEDNNR